MRHLFFSLLALCLFAVPALADEYVHGYTKNDGTYVPPHYRSSPNGTDSDNWSSKGNSNPYTGEQGTKDPYGSNNGYGQGNGSGNGGYNGFNSKPKTHQKDIYGN
jgi:hypothetical protein